MVFRCFFRAPLHQFITFFPFISLLARSRRNFVSLLYPHRANSDERYYSIIRQQESR
jgi:hypothetical protein